MPQNFDELLEGDMEFILGGEAFHMKYARPEALAAWEDEDVPESDTAANALVRLDNRILTFLPDDEHDKYRALRAREENPVPMKQLRALVRWMLEQQSDRPTTQPSPSVPGRGRTARTSAAA